MMDREQWGQARLALVVMGVLVGASLTSAFFVPLLGRQVRPEHLAAPLVFAAFVGYQLTRRRTVVRWDAITILATSWVLVNALSSWLLAPQPTESLVHTVRLGFLVLAFFTVANLPLHTAARWTMALRTWMALGLAGVSYGVLIWVLALLGDVWFYGASIEPELSGISIRGTFYERNLFGIFAGTTVVVSAYLLAAERYGRGGGVVPSRLLRATCAVSTVALVVSLTRSAWVATVAAGPVAYVVFDRRSWGRADHALRLTSLGLPILVGLMLAIVTALPSVQTDRAAEYPPAMRLDPTLRPVVEPEPEASEEGSVQRRLQTFTELEEDFTLTTRLRDALWAIEDWLASPFLGRGTGSFIQIHGTRRGTPAWISNLFAHTLVDTGLVGLAIQGTLFVLIAFRTWRAARETRHQRLAYGLRALTLGFFAMVLAYQLTDGTWLAVFWVHCGLMVSGLYCVDDEINGAVATS